MHNVVSDFNKVDQPAPHCECTLDCLANGTKGEVCSVTGSNRCRLAELGFRTSRQRFAKSMRNVRIRRMFNVSCCVWIG